jgi:hypothetical protein
MAKRKGYFSIPAVNSCRSVVLPRWRHIIFWRVSSSGMWRRVVCWDATDVSEEHIACHLLNCWFLLKFSSTLKMEAICSSETSAASQQTTRHHRWIWRLLSFRIGHRVFAYLQCNDVISNSDYIASSDSKIMINELETMMKEAVVT